MRTEMQILSFAVCILSSACGEKQDQFAPKPDVCSPQNAVPTPGSWSGQGIEFSVFSDSASIRGTSRIAFAFAGPCTPPAANCFHTESHDVPIYDNIAIDMGRFSYANDRLRVDGQFCASDSANGTFDFNDGVTASGVLEWTASPTP